MTMNKHAGRMPDWAKNGGGRGTPSDVLGNALHWHDANGMYEVKRRELGTFDESFDKIRRVRDGGVALSGMQGRLLTLYDEHKACYLASYKMQTEKSKVTNEHLVEIENIGKKLTDLQSGAVFGPHATMDWNPLHQYNEDYHKEKPGEHVKEMLLMCDRRTRDFANTYKIAMFKHRAADLTQMSAFAEEQYQNLVATNENYGADLTTLHKALLSVERKGDADDHPAQRVLELKKSLIIAPQSLEADLLHEAASLRGVRVPESKVEQPTIDRYPQAVRSGRDGPILKCSFKVKDNEWATGYTCLAGSDGSYTVWAARGGRVKKKCPADRIQILHSDSDSDDDATQHFEVEPTEGSVAKKPCLTHRNSITPQSSQGSDASGQSVVSGQSGVSLD